jgi:sporulation protein YlmC with PRC-barrel domain
MRFIPVLVAAALAASTGTAMAQMGSPSLGGASHPPGAGPGITQPPHVPAVNPLAAEDVAHFNGTPVYGSDDREIGSVSTEVMDPASKRIKALVVAEGGVFGIGAHKVSLPVEQFTWDSGKECLRVQKTAADLKSMPAWADTDAVAASGSSVPAR